MAEDEESPNAPIPLSDMLVTLQKELSRVRQISLLAAKGEKRALICDDVAFKITFKFTPVASSGSGDEETVDSILVDEAGVHEMTLEGKISPQVELE